MNANTVLRVRTGREVVEVTTLKDAARLVRAATRMVGATEWYANKGAGEVTDGNGRVVAQVSYNGRVWEPGKYPTAEIKID